MRRLLAASLVIAALSCAYFFHLHNTRSSTVQLTRDGYSLTFKMRWGWGMEESFQFTANNDGWLSSGSSSPWIEILAKPYRSGLAVYVSADNRSYYVGTGYQLFIMETQSGDLQATCSASDVPPYTMLGKQLSNSRTRGEADGINPGGKDLFEYIEPEQLSGKTSTEPPASKYYANIKYLGKFGLVRSGGRGNEIRFVSSDIIPEPRMALNPNCG